MIIAKATLNGKYLSNFNFLQAQVMIHKLLIQMEEGKATGNYTKEGIRCFESKMLPKGEMKIWFGDTLEFIITGTKEM